MRWKCNYQRAHAAKHKRGEFLQSNLNLFHFTKTKDRYVSTLHRNEREKKKLKKKKKTGPDSEPGSNLQSATSLIYDKGIVDQETE